MRILSSAAIALASTSLVLWAGLSGAAEVTTRHSVSIKAGPATISAVVLTNTHLRTYTDTSRPPMAPNRCDLAAKDVGVVWKVVVEGAEISPKEIKIIDERGRAFQQICWSSSGTVHTLDKTGKRTGGGPQTEFLAAGPESPRRLTLKVAGASAAIDFTK